MRLALTGSHSTGKSSILNALPYTPKIQEIGRDLIKMYLVKPHEMERETRERFQYDYWELQKTAEDTHNINTGSFFSDRSLCDILAYDFDLYGEDFSKLQEIKHRYDIICYIPIEFGLVRDDVRSEDIEYQKLIDKRIQRILQHLDLIDKHCKQVVISGTVEERVKQIENLLK